MVYKLLRRNAQLFYNASLLAQLAGLGLLFLSKPYYAGVGATVALGSGLLSVYSLTAGTEQRVVDVVKQISTRSRLFVALAVLIVFASIGGVAAKVYGNGGTTAMVTMTLVVRAYARVALAFGATALLLYADYQRRETDDSNDEESAAQPLGPDEVESMDWEAVEE